MEERFPNVEWFCDRCHAKLNNQPGFNDHKYIWKCTRCGYKTSISRTNIIYHAGPSFGVTVLGKSLGILDSIIVYALLLYICNACVFHAPTPLPWLNLPVIGSAYFLLYIFTMIFERGIAKYCTEMKLLPYIVSSFFVYLWGDIIRPIIEPVIFVKTLISYAFSKKKWLYNLAQSIILGIAYTTILILIILSLVWMSQNAVSNPVLETIHGWFSGH